MSHQLTGPQFGHTQEANDMDFLDRLERDPESITTMTHETMMEKDGCKAWS